MVIRSNMAAVVMPMCVLVRSLRGRQPVQNAHRSQHHRRLPVRLTLRGREPLGGQNYANVTTSGGWTNDSAKSTVGEVVPGIGSIFAGAGSSSTATFSYTPSITAHYEVVATWAKDLDACTQTAFTVTHDGTPATVFMNQRTEGNQWRHLGTYHLTAGTTYSVTVDAAASTGGPRVYADAVRWASPGISTHVLAATFETGPCVNCNVPWADADGDMDVDMDDFASFPAMPDSECTWHPARLRVHGQPSERQHRSE